MEKLPSVIIHVTVRNAKNTIEKCIDSLLKVNYSNKQIYITDAFSTDGTYDILKRYGSKIKLERVKGNASTAHNYMIKKIKTDFIAFTDADCVVDRNWLKNLISSFTSKDIIAAGGLCKTPKDVNRLQRAIGKELEYRFLQFPKFVSRLPTMNLCVRTDIAKKVRMNEDLDVTFETEWGYRLTKHGKMIYVPHAVVYHYHRPTWKSFFKQQANYGKFVIISLPVYIGKSRILGDHITTPMMGIQLLLFTSLILSLFLSLIVPKAIFLSLDFFILLIIFYSIDIMKFSKSFANLPLMLIIYFVRTAGWIIGYFLGILEVIRRRIK